MKAERGNGEQTKRLLDELEGLHIKQKGEKETMEIYKAEPTKKGLNGYQITANSYREYLKRYPETPQEEKEDMQRRIKVNDFLGTCSDWEICEMFNSSAFNDIVKGYVELCADTLDYSEEQKTALMGRLYRMFDDKTAQEAKAYFYR